MKIVTKLILLFITITVVGCVEEEEYTLGEDTTNQGPFEFPSDIQVPNLGLLGTRINIVGTDLIADSLKISFEAIEALRFQKGEDTVEAVVPRELSNANVQLTLSNINNDSIYYNGDFSLKAPQITGVELDEVRFGEPVWIYGENFDTNYEYVKAYINNEEVFVNEATYDSLQIYIPNSTGTSSLDIKIEAQLQEVTVEALTALKPPVFSVADDTAYIGNILTLYGDNFNQDVDFGSFKINQEINAEIESIFNHDSLWIRVPYGPYEDFVINRIDYETADIQTNYNNPIAIGSDYVMHFKNDPAFVMSEVMEYNGKLYFLGSDNNDTSTPPTIYLWEANLADRLWNKIESVALNGYAVTNSLNANGELYVYLDSTEDGFKKIDLNNLTLHNLVNIPDTQPRIAPVVISKNDAVYVGKGTNPSSSNDYTDLYKYDINTNEWESASTDATALRQSKTFSFQGQTYVLAYDIGSSITYFLNTFDSNTNSFSLVPNSTLPEGNYFVYNNKLIRVSNTVNNSVNFVDVLANQQLATVVNILDNGFFNLFTSGGKVFFKSLVTNNIYNPSSAFYLLDDTVTSQF